ncbi:hypothetical protein ACPPVO_33610 [Dactylosporangium sp. McL0621]|uniref:hypothetical protein n=1 Tax=Dactylosporangium sp. McL0621 TaxID=3415678 RepID=UPI003CE8692C
MLLRPPYLALTSVFTLIRLTPMTDSDKNVEILTLRHRRCWKAHIGADDRQLC